MVSNLLQMHSKLSQKKKKKKKFKKQQKQLVILLAIKFLIKLQKGSKSSPQNNSESETEVPRKKYISKKKTKKY